MPFQIFELVTGADGKQEMKAVPKLVFEEKKDALAHIEGIVGNLDHFDGEQGYWWVIDAKGVVKKYVIEGI